MTSRVFQVMSSYFSVCPVTKQHNNLLRVRLLFNILTHSHTHPLKEMISVCRSDCQHNSSKCQDPGSVDLAF